MPSSPLPLWPSRVKGSAFVRTGWLPLGLQTATLTSTYAGKTWPGAPPWGVGGRSCQAHWREVHPSDSDAPIAASPGQLRKTEFQQQISILKRSFVNRLPPVFNTDCPRRLERKFFLFLTALKTDLLAYSRGEMVGKKTSLFPKKWPWA